MLPHNFRALPTMLFEPHGDIRFWVEGRLHFVEIRGPWNAELIAAYRRHSAADVQALTADGPWAAVVIPRVSAMFTDDAADELRAMLNDNQRTLHRVAACYVIGPDVEGYHLCEGILRDIYEPSSAFAVFETLPPARAWCDRLVAEALNGGTAGGP